MRIPNNRSAAMQNHRCCATGCKRFTSIQYLMCSFHWNMVPACLQTEIWANCHRGKRLNSHPTDQYLHVVNLAIEAVENAEERYRNQHVKDLFTSNA